MTTERQPPERRIELVCDEIASSIATALETGGTVLTEIKLRGQLREFAKAVADEAVRRATEP